VGQDLDVRITFGVKAVSGYVREAGINDAGYNRSRITSH
jgi:hypothetical protein